MVILFMAIPLVALLTALWMILYRKRHHSIPRWFARAGRLVSGVVTTLYVLCFVFILGEVIYLLAHSR